MKKILLFSLLAVLLALPATAAAERGKIFTAEGFRGFSDGHFSGTSINESGILSLGYTARELAEFTANNFIDGVVWNKRLYLADADNSVIIVTDFEGHVLQQINLDGRLITALNVVNDVLYVATGPGARILRIEADGTASDYANFDSDFNYIWQMYPYNKNEMLVATGEPGVLMKMNIKTVTGTSVINLNNSHFTKVITDPSGLITVGGGKRGMLFQGRDGQPFRSFLTTDTDEIQAMLYNNDVLYVVATKGSGKLLRDKDVEEGEIGAYIYRIEPDGYNEVIASSSDEMILDMIAAPNGDLLITTASAKYSGFGRIYAYSHRNRELAIVYESTANRINKLIPVDKDNWLAILGGGTKLELISKKIATSGTFTSDVIKSGIISHIGRVSMEGKVAAGQEVKVAMRSGLGDDPDFGWSEWSDYLPWPGGAVEIPDGNYFQFKIAINNPLDVPVEIKKVNVSYMRRNLRPVIFEVMPLADNIELKVTAQKRPEAKNGVEELNLDEAKISELATKAPEKQPLKTKVSKTYSQGVVTMAWRASDPNDDELLHNLYYQAVNEKDWHLLVADSNVPFYSIKAGQLADGHYIFKVESSDSPDNSSERALVAEEISPIVIIDNTAPVIENVKVVTEKKVKYLTFRVRDLTSNVAKVSVAVNGENYLEPEPVDNIFDSELEEFKVKLSDLKKGANNLVIMAEDSRGNRANYSETIK